MRFTLSLLSLLFALLLVVNGDVSQSEQSLTTEVDALTGAVYHIIDSEGDLDGDDDDDDGQQPIPQAQGAKSESTLVARKRGRKHKHKHRKNRGAAKQNFLIGKPSGVKEFPHKMEITWYASNDLKNPACGDGSWDPNNNNHIGAVMKHWETGPQCGDFVYICNEDAHNHCLRVRVVDYCAGCDTNAVDLSKSAFKRLSPSGGLDEGRIKNLRMYHSEKPNPFDKGLFGPFRLRKN